MTHKKLIFRYTNKQINFLIPLYTGHLSNLILCKLVCFSHWTYMSIVSTIFQNESTFIFSGLVKNVSLCNFYDFCRNLDYIYMFNSCVNGIRFNFFFFTKPDFCPPVLRNCKFNLLEERWLFSMWIIIGIKQTILRQNSIIPNNIT